MDLILAILLGILVSVLSFCYFKIRPRNFPPGPYGLPVVGYLPFLGKYPHQTFAKLAKKYGGVLSVRLGNVNVVVLNDWPSIKEALINQSDVFSGRPQNIFSEELTHHQSIIFTDGPGWKERRRFSMQYLKEHGFGKSIMEPIIMDEIHKVLDSLTAEKDRKIEINDYFKFSFFNIIWKFVDGKSHTKEDTVSDDFIAILHAIFSQASNTNPIFFMPCLRLLFVSQFASFKRYNVKLESFLQKQIDEHIGTYQDGIVRDFMDSFLREMYKRQKNGEETSSYKRDNLLNILKDFFAAGADAPNATVVWSLLYMATWPMVQEKVQEEIDHVVGRERLPEAKDRPSLKYTEAVLWEVHRYSSIVPLAVGHTTTKETQVFEYYLPKGTMIFPNLWALHHDQNLWIDPESFRPDRFLNDKGEVQKPDYLIPFSAGSRACLGEALAKMSTFLFFACLMHRFTFSLVTGEKVPSLEPVYTVNLTAKPFSLLVKSR